MKRFKTKNRNKDIIRLIVIIMIIVYIMLRIYNNNISNKVLDIAIAKTDEINTLLVKKDILPVSNINDLLNINVNDDNEIIYVDVDYNESYRIMKDIVNRIQNNIFLFESGNIDEFTNNRELHSFNNSLYLLIPLGYALNGVLLTNFGPKIPILISMYEHVLGNIETEVLEYGINNALLNVTLTLSLEQRILMPYYEKKISRDYKIILGSKVINGRVPTIYNGHYKNSSSILEIA